MTSPTMRATSDHRFKSAALLLCAVTLASGSTRAGAEQASDQITAVSARASPDYIRLRAKGRGYERESYAFGEGGHFGGPMRDPSIDNLRFIDVARTISVPLAEQNYWPSREPQRTKLLIMVYWGLTFVPDPYSSDMVYQRFSGFGPMNNLAPAGGSSHYHPGGTSGRPDGWDNALTMMNMVNQERTHTDFLNAAMLGYDSEGVIGTDYGNNIRGTPLAVMRDDLFAEIEDNRYFVVLMAYDFQLMWKQKKHRLLWETRFSIRQRHNNFDKALDGMAEAASAYFGQNSARLVHKPVPVGRVEIGPLKGIGEPEDK